MDHREFSLGSRLSEGGQNRPRRRSVQQPRAGCRPPRRSTRRCALHPSAVTTVPLMASDTNWYALAPGESADQFTGAGWVLSGGAKIVTTTARRAARTNSVLDLPGGSQRPSARRSAWTAATRPFAPNVRDVAGVRGSVQFYVSYAGHEHMEHAAEHTARSTAQQTDWTLFRPGQRPAQQHVRLAARPIHARPWRQDAATSRSTTSSRARRTPSRRARRRARTARAAAASAPLELVGVVAASIMNVEWRLPSPAWPQLHAGRPWRRADLDASASIASCEAVDRDDDVLARPCRRAARRRRARRRRASATARRSRASLVGRVDSARASSPSASISSRVTLGRRRRRSRRPRRAP